ncbi:MAG: fibronectin type III domain-containing protein [Elusimicrobiota bacterium]
MKKIFFVLCFTFTVNCQLSTANCLYAAGFRLGMTGAVKEKVKELDKKVREKKAEPAVVTSTVTYPSQGLSGTAAKGKPITSATVSVKDSAGLARTATTGTDGKYNVDVTSLTFPMLLKVTEGTATYFSIANASGTCNIHPFTDMVVRTYFKSTKGVSDMKDAFDNNFAALGTLPAKETIDTIKSVVATVVSSILERNGIDPLTYDMFTTTFDANSTGFDKAIEQTEITAASDYSYTVIKDTTTNVVISTITPTINDTTAPATPTNPAATGVSGTSVKLSWTASADTDVAGYAIYRGGVKITAVSYTSFIDVGLTPGTQYSYTIEAYDWAGNKSAKTSAVSATTLSEFAITSTGKFDGIPAAASDGTDFLIVYAIRDSTNVPYNLKAQFVLCSGTLGQLVSFDVFGSTIHGGGVDVANVAYGSSKYLIVYRSTEIYNNNAGNLYGIFVTPAGVKSSPFLITNAHSKKCPGVASDGTNYLVSWVDYRNGSQNKDIYGQLVASNGSLIGSEIPIATASYNQRASDLVYRGGKYLVTWEDNRRQVDVSTDSTHKYYYTDIYARFISTSGSLGSEIAIDVNDLASDNPVFAAFNNVNNKYLIVFHDETRTTTETDWNLYGRLMDSNGNVTPRFVISEKPWDNHIAIPVFDGSKYFITWSDGLGTADVKSQAAFFDTNGNRLGNEVKLLVRKGSENFVMSWPLFIGTKYFLSILRATMTQDYESSWEITNGDIYGMFFTP